MHVPNAIESERRYARRCLYDLAHILEHLSTENWDNPSERAALLRALESHAGVLRSIANHISEVGTFKD